MDAEQKEPQKTTIDVDYSKIRELHDQVTVRGVSVYNDKRILTSLVSDIFATNEKLLNILKIVIDGNEATELAKLLSLDVSEQKIGIKRICNRFAERFSIKPSRVAEALYVLASGLGMNESALSDI